MYDLYKFLKKCGLSSDGGQSGEGSHFLTHFPTFPHVVHWTQKSQGFRYLGDEKNGYDKKCMDLGGKNGVFLG